MVVTGGSWVQEAVSSVSSCFSRSVAARGWFVGETRGGICSYVGGSDSVDACCDSLERVNGSSYVWGWCLEVEIGSGCVGVLHPLR